MSEELKKQPGGAGEDESAGIAQVQDLLHAVQRSLGGAQDKYHVLEEAYNTQGVELTETKNENARLKKKLQKALAKLNSAEEKTQEKKEKETIAKEEPFRPSRVLEAQRASENKNAWLQDVYLNRSRREEPKLIRGKCTNPFAFCVLVMNRDAYALGAAVLAYRLRKLNSKADIVCLVTRDVSLGVVEALASEFTAVFQVPYLEYNCRKLTTKKQQQYYGSWIERAFTKWNVLALTMYKKVLLLDADILPVSNIDHLFDMSAPAAVFSSPWAKTYRKDGYEDPYKGLRHGDQVANSMIRDAVSLSLQHSENLANKGSYVAQGGVVLLEPNLAGYGIFNAFVCSQQPFGIPGCHSGFDEQSIVLFYYLQNPEVQWTHISQGYNALCWHQDWLEGCDVKCYHYFNAKPWELRPDMYPDLRMWYQALRELSVENPQCSYLTEVCMTDTSFLDIYEKMISENDGKEFPLRDGAEILKPSFAHEGEFNDSSSSSPRVPPAKASKPPSGTSTKSKSPPSDDSSDPPKTDAHSRAEVLSVCSDGGLSKHSEAVSVRSRESNRTVVYHHHHQQRQQQSQPKTWYDDFDRLPSKDPLTRRPLDLRREGHHHATMLPPEDYVMYQKDHHKSSGHVCGEHCGTGPDFRRFRRHQLSRDHTKTSEHTTIPRNTSDAWLARKRVPGPYGDALYDRSGRPVVMSHSPVNPRTTMRFDSFGSSSTSSGSYRLPSKLDSRRHY